MKRPCPWLWMYKTKFWQMRRLHQLKQHPLCAHCLRDGGYIREARVVHHIEPHKGDYVLFCTSPVESLCKPCHDAHTASVERAGLPVKRRTALDGWWADEDA